MFWMYFSFAGVVVGDPVAGFDPGVAGVAGVGIIGYVLDAVLVLCFLILELQVLFILVKLELLK